MYVPGPKLHNYTFKNNLYYFVPPKNNTTHYINNFDKNPLCDSFLKSKLFILQIVMTTPWNFQ